jgi:uncharacterized OB-fold protein
MNTQSPVKIWRNQANIATMLGREGIIVSWTIVRVPPAGFSNLAPYPVVVVDIGEGKRITAQLVDWSESDLEFRKKVRVVVRRISEPSTEGIIPYGIKVKPI